MELLARTRIKYPRDLVFSTIRDKMPQMAPHMPNVKTIVVTERVDDGPVTRLVNVWTAATEIPAIARRYVTPDMLKWTDRARWDTTDFTCQWSIETHAWPGVVECHGKTTYAAAGGETDMEIKGVLDVHVEKASVPRLLAGTVRPLIERIIIASLRPNLISIGDSVAKYLVAEGKR